MLSASERTSRMLCLMFWLLLGSSLAIAQTSAPSLAEGDAAFLPQVVDSYGDPVDLAAIVAEGQWLVLWFYPQAMTSGCSAQASRYTDLYPDFTALGARVFGVSADTPESQCEFIESMALAGQMIPDVDRSMARAYGIDGFFFSRDTVLINPQGRVQRIWRRVSPLEDADRVLEYLQQQMVSSY